MEVQRASACPRCGRVFIEGERVCPFDASPLREQAVDAADPLIGSIVGGSYVVLSKLGEGGMGVVYRALQQRLEREVALKVLGPHFGGDLKASERFRSEARAVSQLTCPHTVTVHDFGSTEDGTLYLAMQLLQGESLRARMARRALTPLEAVSVAADICDSLAEAHERTPQIIHRDIKPDNIFVRATDAGALFATVLDFGLARIQDSQKLTASNAVIGTVAYMAPEQAQGRKDVDGRLDLYALGVMLFEMLAGRLPFDSPDKLGVMYQHVYAAPPKLRGLVAGRALPSSLEGLVESLLAKSPAQRPPSARAVRGKLLEIEQELIGAAGNPQRPPDSRDEQSAEDDEPTVIRRPPESPEQSATAGARANEAHAAGPDTDPDPAPKRPLPSPRTAAPRASLAPATRERSDTAIWGFPRDVEPPEPAARRAAVTAKTRRPADEPTAVLPRLGDRPAPEDRSTSEILVSAGLAQAAARRTRTAWLVGAAVVLGSLLGAALLWRGPERPTRSAAPAPAPISAPPAAPPRAPAPESPLPAPAATPKPGSPSSPAANGAAPGAATPTAEKAAVKKSKKSVSPKSTPDLDDEMREYLQGSGRP